MKNDYFYQFFFYKIFAKYSPKRTKLHHLIKKFVGAYPRTPSKRVASPNFQKKFEPPPPEMKS